MRKPGIMGIFAKIEIALYMSSTNVDLTLLQIRDRSPILHGVSVGVVLLQVQLFQLKRTPEFLQSVQDELVVTSPLFLLLGGTYDALPQLED